MTAPTFARGLLAAALSAIAALIVGHFITPAVIGRSRSRSSGWR
jgi:hypothetical protein